MTEAEALKLFARSYIPIAITSAAEYIADSEGEVSPSDFLQRLQYYEDSLHKYVAVGVDDDSQDGDDVEMVSNGNPSLQETIWLRSMS